MTVYQDPQTVHTPTTGASPPAVWGQSVRDDLQFLNTWVGCYAEVTPGSVPDGLVDYYIGYATEATDSDNFHSSTYPTRFTIPTGLGGKYLVGYQFNGLTAASSTQPHNVQIRVRFDGAGASGVINHQYLQPLNYSLEWAISGVFPAFLGEGRFFELSIAQQTLPDGADEALSITGGNASIVRMGA